LLGVENVFVTIILLATWDIVAQHHTTLHFIFNVFCDNEVLCQLTLNRVSTINNSRTKHWLLWFNNTWVFLPIRTLWRNKVTWG